MEKKFNVTGTCIPARHFMADTSDKLAKAMSLIEEGSYFIIARPRQYGKTTTLSLLRKKLDTMPDYLTFSISLEGLHNEAFESEEAFGRTLFHLLEDRAKLKDDSSLASLVAREGQGIQTLKDLSDAITNLVRGVGNRKIVLFIDEVDKSSNNDLFVSFLGLLRTKFLAAMDELDFTFHAVVLAGLHDVKNLKAKIRQGDEPKYNSPWNIAADFDVEMELLPHEIAPMLEDYSQQRGVAMDVPAVADALFYYTSGYPFLVSALSKIVDEKLLPAKNEKTWTAQDVETAADNLIKSERSNTNFDTLIKNLENDPELYDLVFRVVIENEMVPFNFHAPLINKGVLHGIFRNGGRLRIQNRIYQEVITNYMTAKMLTEGKSLSLESTDPYLLPDKALDLEKVLTRFQQLMREEYSRKDKDFLERNGRLLFLAFLKPILNAKGHTFKEPEISEERRMDIAITFFQHKYVVELKLWRGEAAHAKGLSQLAGYLHRQHLDEGFLVIFDKSGKKTWRKEWVEAEGKRVFAVWV